MNKIEIPTYVFLTVEYTETGFEKPDGQALARASYKGVTLKVEYGASRTDTRSYFTGDFITDYNAAVAWVDGFGQADTYIQFMASSSLDDYMHDAGYDTEQNMADQAALDAWKTEEIPFASDADLAADQAEMAAKLAEVFPVGLTRPSEESVARFTAVTDRAVEIDRKLEAAWDRVPAVKLRWALANVIASSDYNTSYPGAPLGRAEAMDAIAVLNDLLADEDFADSMRPRD